MKTSAKKKYQQPKNTKVGATQKTWKPGKYIVSSAQNNTGIHSGFVDALSFLAKKENATVLIVPVVQYKGLGIKKDEVEWSNKIPWPLITIPMHFAPDLFVTPNTPVSPSASRPLTGLGAISKGSSMIIGHQKTALESVATPSSDRPVFLYTTGSITKPHHTISRAGARGESHHTTAALIIEVRKDGAWWVRQLHWSSHGGCIYDLQYKYTSKKRSVSRASGLVIGGLHYAQRCDVNNNSLWGKGGLASLTKPRVQVMHDVLGMFARNPHEKDSFLTAYNRWKGKKESIQDEFDELYLFLKKISKKTKTVIVSSNHDDMLDRWLASADFRTDPINAELFFRLWLDKIRTGGKPALDLLMSMSGNLSNVKMLSMDEKFEIAGIECGMHGHIGPSGARGNIRSFGALCMKSVTGHTHSCSIFDAAYSVGVSGNIKQSYCKGPGSSSHSHVIIHPGGKRQVITLWSDHTHSLGAKPANTECSINVK